MQAAHDLDIKGFQRVASGLDEVDTSMNTIVDNVHPVHFVLCFQVRIKPLLDIFNDWPPRIIIVHEIAEARSINNSKPQTDAALFNVGTNRLNRYSLWNNVQTRSFALSGRVQGRVEEGVDESGFAQARFTCDGVSLSLRVAYASPLASRMYIPTTITLKLNPLRTLLRCH